MRKLLIMSAIALSIVGCSQRELTPEELTAEVTSNKYVQIEIKKLQAQLERGEVTEAYAQEKLKQILKQRIRQNSGEPEVILEKIGAQDPMIEKGLAEMIKNREESK